MSGWVELRLLLGVFGGWVGRREAQMIAYLVEENRVLKEQIAASGGRIRLTDDQRRRLAAKGKLLGRKSLRRIAAIASPDTILAWHRRLIAAKWTYSRKSPGRPSVAKDVRALIVRIARENPRWGASRIQGALKHLDHQVGRSTISRVLRDQGIPPAPERTGNWATFIRAHRHLIAAADFFVTEVWTPRGLVTHYTLFVIDLATRAVRVAGTTPNPSGEWILQVARSLTDCVDGCLREKRYVILDRDGVFAPKFVETLESAGLKVVRTSYRAPNMNAYAERFVQTIKSECLEQMIFVGSQSLVRAIQEFVVHYNSERPHQGLGNRLIHGQPSPPTGRIRVRERLGGVLKYYYRRPAA